MLAWKLMNVKCLILEYPLAYKQKTYYPCNSHNIPMVGAKFNIKCAVQFCWFELKRHWVWKSLPFFWVVTLLTVGRLDAKAEDTQQQWCCWFCLLLYPFRCWKRHWFRTGFASLASQTLGKATWSLQTTWKSSSDVCWSPPRMDVPSSWGHAATQLHSKCFGVEIKKCCLLTFLHAANENVNRSSGN